MLPFTEQSAMYNAVNFGLTSSNWENLTISGVQLNILTCPSEPLTAPTLISKNTTLQAFNVYNINALTGTWLQYFSSYAGCAGTWDFGFITYYPPAEFAQYNGVIYNDSSVTIAQVTDGTSNTLLFGEHSRFNMQKAGSTYVNSDFSWNSGAITTRCSRPSIPSTPRRSTATRITMARTPRAGTPAARTSRSRTAR